MAGVYDWKYNCVPTPSVALALSGLLEIVLLPFRTLNGSRRVGWSSVGRCHTAKYLTSFRAHTFMHAYTHHTAVHECSHYQTIPP